MTRVRIHGVPVYEGQAVFYRTSGGGWGEYTAHPKETTLTLEPRDPRDSTLILNQDLLHMAQTQHRLALTGEQKLDMEFLLRYRDKILESLGRGSLYDNQRVFLWRIICALLYDSPDELRTRELQVLRQLVAKAEKRLGLA